MKYIFDGASLQNGRRSNMDSLLLCRRDIDGDSVLLAVVCDGVGSLAEGAFAAAMAVRMLNEWFGGIQSTERLGMRLRDEVAAIHEYILESARASGIETAATLSALLLAADTYCIVHTGDSRVYERAGDTLRRLTVDDVSPSGKLTACIGHRLEAALQYYEGKAAAGQTFLLCSDGLYKRVGEDVLWMQMGVKKPKDMQRAIRFLTEYAIERGERDNISLALVKIES